MQLSLKKRYNTLSEKSKRYLKLATGVTVGAALGFSYYYFVGCQSGGCPITSDPLISTGYGAVMGGLFTGIK